MEKLAVILIPGLLALVLLRLMVLPLKLAWKLAAHCGCGFACLWLLNTIAPFTGIFFPINAVTVLLAGVLGLPGIALMALLTLIP